MDAAASALLIDLYELNMVQAYLDRGRTATAVFELFVRKLPDNRAFLLAAGLEQALDYLETLRFTPDEIAWLKGTGRFGSNCIDYLRTLRFSGDVQAMPEGTVFFENEPILRVTAPLPEAQLVESRLLNILHFQTLIASKAARTLLLAPGKLMVDFGLRRAHGAEAGLLAARASYIAGFAGTATVLAEQKFGIPSFGTMAHSFIQSYEDEETAFAEFARSRPANVTLLIDSYDTVAAARKVVHLAPQLAADGISIRAVRIDSGDLNALSRQVRQILDEGGLREVRVFASGGIDDGRLASLIAAGAPIDGFGIGTSLTTSSDAPALDCAYKLEDYAGVPRRKRSAGKATWPGRKQVWRRLGADGRLAGDVLSLEDDRPDGEPLLVPVMQKGKRLQSPPTLAAIREHAARELSRLPDALRRLDGERRPMVSIGGKLAQLTTDMDQKA